jgi:succinate dehydrogenase/fumarate reductase flavoprotein subunit
VKCPTASEIQEARERTGAAAREVIEALRECIRRPGPESMARLRAAGKRSDQANRAFMRIAERLQRERAQSERPGVRRA